MGEFKVWVGDCSQEEKLCILKVLDGNGVKWSEGERAIDYVPEGSWNYLVDSGYGMQFGASPSSFNRFKNVETITAASLLEQLHGRSPIHFSEEEFMDLIGV